MHLFFPVWDWWPARFSRCPQTLAVHEVTDNSSASSTMTLKTLGHTPPPQGFSK